MRRQTLPQPDFIPMTDATVLADLRIGITGATGVLGSILLNRCLEAGVSTHAFEGDITEQSAVRSWIRHIRPDAVFHFAAIVPVDVVDSDPVRAFTVNALGTMNLAASVGQEAPQSWVFLASSSHVYAAQSFHLAAPLPESGALGPTSTYGRTKLAGEILGQQVLETFRIRHAIGRIFSFGHTRQASAFLVPGLLSRLSDTIDGGTLAVMNSNAVRDVMDGETVIDVVLALAARRVEGVVNIGSGVGWSVGDLAARLATIMGKSVTVTSAGEHDASKVVADVTRLRLVLGDSQ